MMTKEEFNKLHNRLLSKIKAVIDEFITSSAFKEYVDFILEKETPDKDGNIPFNIWCEISLDSEGTFSINSSEYAYLTTTNLLVYDEDIRKNIDLFDLYFNLDNCVELENTVRIFKDKIKKGLADYGLKVGPVSKFEEAWLTDHTVVSKYTIPVKK